MNNTNTYNNNNNNKNIVSYVGHQIYLQVEYCSEQ